ncbi:MAG: OmpA family protein [Deltaproteobacteria bacterium]|nr:OmpA family protein [Deltaproteobacteria bacterium]
MMLLTLALTALGQQVPVPDLDAQLYRHPIDAQYSLWADDTYLQQSGSFIARLGVGYTRNPLIYKWDNDEVDALLSDVVQTNLLGAYTYQRVRVGLDAPIYLLAHTPDGSNFGLGDVAADMKLRWLERGEGSPGVAGGLRLSLPTTTVDAPLGSPGAGYALQAIVDHQVGPALLALNLGTRGVPKQDLENIVWNDQLFFRAAAGVPLTDTAGVSLDLAGHMNYQEALRNTAGSPLEALLGGWGRVASTDYVVRGGVGAGLTPGIGSPAFRAVLMVGWEPANGGDRDLDGIPDKQDGCPQLAEDLDRFEDRDGCPDTDNDQDRIADVADACPDEAEDLDGFEDQDGCPEADNDQDGLLDGEDTCPNEAEDLDGYKDQDGCPDKDLTVHLRFEGLDGNPLASTSAHLLGAGAPREGGSTWKLTLDPGTYQVQAQAPGYQPVEAELVIGTDEERVERTWTLQPLVVLGKVRVQVTDPSGASIDARWSFDTQEAIAVPGGEATMDLVPGMHEMTVRADGYTPVAFPVEVLGNEEITLPITLTPSKVQITREKIDIADKVYFETGSARIKPESFDLLKEIATLILDHPEVTLLRIEGHTDARGNDAYNLQLSKDRAASVRAYMMEMGVEGSRLESEGYGETRPIDDRQVEEAWEANRRVEFFIAARSDEE